MTDVVLAIDPARRCGWAVLAGSDIIAGSVDLERWPDRVSKANVIGGRLNNLSFLVRSLAEKHGATVVACEHPPVVPGKEQAGDRKSFGSRTSSALFQYHGEVARTADALGIPFDGDIYPSTAKKAATGSGRHSSRGLSKSQKADEVLAGLRRRQITIESLTLDDNAIDAIAVALAAEDRLG